MVTVATHESGVEVIVCRSSSTTTTYLVAECQAHDMDTLAIIFQYEVVHVFQTVVELIGNVVRARDKVCT